jgi:hypothetical protein
MGGDGARPARHGDGNRFNWMVQREDWWRREHTCGLPEPIHTTSCACLRVGRGNALRAKRRPGWIAGLVGACSWRVWHCDCIHPPPLAHTAASLLASLYYPYRSDLSDGRQESPGVTHRRCCCAVGMTSLRESRTTTVACGSPVAHVIQRFKLGPSFLC